MGNLPRLSDVHYRHLIGNATAMNATISKGTNKIAGVISYSPSTAQDTLQGEKFLGDYLSGLPTQIN